MISAFFLFVFNRCDDELVEVTPKNIRIRKKILDAAEAKRKEKGMK